MFNLGSSYFHVAFTTVRHLLTVRVEPHTLPPTSASAKQHCLRVYVQVRQWQGVGMDASGWGWAIRDERMVPVMTEMEPAPDYLLDAIHCGCNADCSTRRCSCRKYNLECSSACTECKPSWQNSSARWRASIGIFIGPQSATAVGPTSVLPIGATAAR